jgi:polynucleotide 5'-kinase involved in rRNA processing
MKKSYQKNKFLQKPKGSIKTIFERSERKNELEKIFQEAFEKQRVRVQTCTEMCVKIIFFMMLGDKYGFDVEKLKELQYYVDDAADAIIKDYMTFEDVLKVCTEEYNMKFTKEELLEIDPSLALVDAVDEEKK